MRYPQRLAEITIPIIRACSDRLTRGAWLVMRQTLALLFLLAGLGWAGGALAATTLNKQVTPATINPADISKFRITIANSSSVSLTAAAVTDNLPAQVTIAATPNIVNTCGFTGVTATPGTAVVKLTGGAIPARVSGVDGQCYFELDVTATSVGNWINTIPANGPANGFTPGGNVAGYQATENTVTVTNTSPASATLSVTALNPPTGSKSFAATTTSALIGEPVPMTIVLTNPSGNGAATLPLTTFNDNLPAGMQVAPTPNASVDCTTQGTGGVNGAFTPSAGATTLTLTGGVIGGVSGVNPGICTLKVNVVVNAITNGNTNQTFTNSLAAGAIGNTRGLTSAAFSANLRINTPIGLTKTVLIGTVGTNQDSTLRIDISNSSTINPLTVTSLTDTLPSGLTVGNVTASPPTIDCATGGGTNGTFNPTLAQGDTAITIVNAVVGITGTTRRCRIQVPVRAAAYGNYVNSIPANAVINPNNYTSPTTSATLRVSPVATITKAFNPNSSTNMQQGESSTLTVTFGNGAGIPLTNVTVTDILPTTPGPIVVAAVPNATTGCTGGTVTAIPGSGSVTLSGATIGTSGCNFTVRVTGYTIGTHTNTIPANALVSNQGVTNPDPATANITIGQGLSGGKSFFPTSVATGGVARVSLQINNLAPIPYTGISVVDGPMTNLTIANPANASTTCAGPTSITAIPGANTATLSGATLPGATTTTPSNCLFFFNVLTSGAPSTWNNTLPAGAITSAEGAYNTGSVIASLIRASVNLTLNKSFSVPVVSGGQPSVLRIDVSNPGVQASNATFTDTFPAGIQIYTVPNASTTCLNGVVSATPGGGTVSLSGATLLAGSSCVVFVTVTSVQFGNVDNIIPASAISTTEGFTNSAETRKTLSTVQGLGAAKSFTPTSTSLGQTSRLKITLVSTYNTLGLTGVSFTDTLPSGMTVATTPNVFTDCPGGSVTANSGTNLVTLSGANLGINSSCTVAVDVSATALGVYSNTIVKAQVTADGEIQGSFDSTATLNVVNPPVITKAFSPNPVNVGVSSTLTITLTNSNTQALTGAALTDSLPTGLTIAATPNAATTCTGTGVSVTAVTGSATIGLTNATIPANGSCTFRADVASNTPGAYANQIPIGALTTIEGASNTAPANATLTVSQPPTVAKAFNPASIAVGGTSQLTLTLGNGNATDITLTANMTDTLPSGLVVANPNGLVRTCPGTVTATAGSGTVRYNSGGAIPPGGCTIRVNVTSSQAGIYPNQIPVDGLQTTTGNNQTAATDTVTVLAPVLGLTKTHSGDFTQGQTGAVYTLTVSNIGTQATSGTLTVIDTLPTGLTFVSAGGGDWSCSGASSPTVTCTSSTAIAANGGTSAITLTVDVAANAAGSLTNSASASGGGATNSPTASDPTTILPAPVLGLTKSHTGHFAQGQTNAAYTLTVSNPGGLPTSGTLTVTDTLPAGLSFVSGTGTDWSCGAAGQAVTCTRDTALAANGGTSAIALLVNVASTAGTPLTNTATAAGGGAANTPSASDPTAVWIALSGAFFKDNGRGSPNNSLARNGIQDGTEPNFNINGAAQSYVVILDNNGFVLAVADICPHGSLTCVPGNWTSAVPAGTGYTAYITATTPPALNSHPTPEVSAPTGYWLTKPNYTPFGGSPQVPGGSSPIGSLTFTPATGMRLSFGVLQSQCSI